MMSEHCRSHKALTLSIVVASSFLPSHCVECENLLYRLFSSVAGITVGPSFLRIYFLNFVNISPVEHLCC